MVGRRFNYFLVLSITILSGVFVVIRCGNDKGVVDDGWSGSGPALIDEIEILQSMDRIEIVGRGKVSSPNFQDSIHPEAT